MPQPTSDPGTAGVIARPPILFLSALLSGLAVDYIVPVPVAGLGAGLVRWLGGALIILGFAIASTGIRDFTTAGTPVPTNEPTRALVTTGAHGWTRNPIYVGMFLIYGGIAFAVGSPWALILMLPLAFTMRYGVVAREEAYLERRFGDAYRQYRTRVRRWI